MPTSSQRRSMERARHEVVRAGHRGLDRVELIRTMAEALRPVVHFDGACWHTADPASRLITSQYTGLGVLVPSRNAEVLRWCLANGLRIVQQSTLMTRGRYREPTGAWLPSILY